jgi:hypothetical protein
MCMGWTRGISLLLGVLVVAAVVGLQLRSMLTPPASTLASPPPTSSDLGDFPDASAYAQMAGISLEEAIRRLRLEPQIGQLNAVLESSEPATFAGLWIEQKPAYRVVARFTRDGARTLSRYVEGTSLAGLVQVRPADHTLTRLQEDIELIAGGLSGAPFSAAINVQENRIDIEVDSREEIEEYARGRGFQLPPTAHLVVRGPSQGLDCGEDAGDEYGIFFPRHCTKPWQPVPLALMEAPLVLRDGCLWLVPAHGQETYLAIWPPGWHPVKEGDELQIRDAGGARRGSVGESIAVGGGERMDPHDIAQLIGEEPPALCRSTRAWFVSGPLRP